MLEETGPWVKELMQRKGASNELEMMERFPGAYSP